MPENEVKFTEEELESLKNLQLSYNNLQTNIGVLHLRKAQLHNETEKIDEKIIELEVGFTQLQEQEQSLLKSLEEKYGHGSLDINSGVFSSTT